MIFFSATPTLSPAGPFWVAAVVLADKIASTAWALSVQGGVYKSPAAV